MPRFHFNMRTAHGLVEDLEGTELADLDAALVEAIEDARSAMSNAIRRGIDLSQSALIEIVDDRGELVRQLPFAEAILERS